MENLHIWIILFTILNRSGLILAVEEKPDNNNLTISKTTFSNEEISEEDEFLSPNYVLPKQIFNDGKPFYVEKDPISGQFDFNSKKPAGIETEYNEVINPKEKIVLSATQPNIHDYLNLPVKYSSSKFVYPLVSSSYANLKYQGSNKHYQNHHVGNHQNAVLPIISTTTQSPKYYTKDDTKKDTSKLYPPIIATTVGRPVTSTTRKTSRKTTTTTTTTSTTPVPITTHRPLFDKLATKHKYNPNKKYTTVATSTTPKPLTEKQHKYTRHFTKPMKSTSPTTLTTSDTTEHTTISTTNTPTSTTPRPTPKTIPTKPTIVKATTLLTTISTRKPISTIATTLFKKSKLPTKPTRTSTSFAPSFIPMPTSDRPFPLDLDSSDVYNKVNEKNEPNKMSLADIFNALAEDDKNDQSEYSHQSTLNQGLDKQGNLIQPISPSVPSPFTLHQVTKVSFPTTTRQPYVPTIPIITRPLQTEKPLQISSDVGQQEQHYEIQQSNRIQYHPIPSMNNIVISPDQNSASFVLGSQQAVGSNIYVGSVEKEPLFESKKRPIQFGTVINEDINQIGESRPINLPLNQNIQQGQKQIYSNQPFQSHKIKAEQINSDIDQQQTQELLVSTNIRFPNDIAFSDHDQEQYYGNSNTVNGHAQPVSMSPNAGANPLVFPNLEQELENINNKNKAINNNNNIAFQQDSTQTERPLFQQKQEILTLNQHNLHNKVNFPQLPEDLTPPVAPDHTLRLPHPDKHRDRHPVEPPHRHHLEQSQRPGQIRPHLPSPGSFLYNEFTRNPIGGGHRPNSDRPLPNILPQFRPNAKISQGHPTYNKEPGNIRVTHSKYPPSKRGIPPPPFAHRRTPVNNLDTNRYPMKLIVERLQESNRRVYKVPAPHPYFFNRQYLQRQPTPPPTRLVDSYIDERHASLNTNRKPYNGYPDSEAIPERLPSFEEDDYIVNDSPPPQPILNNRNEHQEDTVEDLIEKQPKLEPVVTLQMIHSHKKASPTDPEDSISDDKLDSFPKTGPSQGVYVVYPELTMGAESQVDVIKDESIGLSELVNSSLGSVAVDYQNTPFSVIRDQPQEPILMVKSKPQSQNKDKFPYAMEKPDIAFAEFSKKQNYDRYNRETTLDTIPRVVNRRNDIENNYYQQSTEIPIAIAYTPTEPNRYYTSNYHHNTDNGKFSYPNFASPVIPEIRDTQTEAAMMMNEYDTRGQNNEKDFMAPFYPSMSLDPVTDSPNGWSVFQASTLEPNKYNNALDKQTINRSDIREKSDDNINEEPLALSQIQPMKQSEIETSTKNKMDQDSFQPELQGGFKPIYPPGYKIKDESSEDVKNIENLDSTILNMKPSILKNENNNPIEKTITETILINNNSTSTESSPLSVTIESTTGSLPAATNEITTTTQKSKQKKPTSLAALLFGDYDDYDYEEKPENAIGKSS